MLVYREATCLIKLGPFLMSINQRYFKINHGMQQVTLAVEAHNVRGYPYLNIFLEPAIVTPSIPYYS